LKINKAIAWGLAAIKRGLIPFQTKLGGNQASGHSREHLSIVMNQIESNFLNFTIWNYNLYNTEDAKDSWNFENTSIILAFNRKPRNIDAVIRLYLMRSCRTCSNNNQLIFAIDYSLPCLEHL
jgi:hypothetical protein